MSWPVNVCLLSVSGMLFKPKFIKHCDCFGGVMSTSVMTLKGPKSSISSEPGRPMLSLDSKCSQCFVLYSLDSRHL